MVGIVAPQDQSLLGLVSRLAPAIVSGNTAVVLASERAPLPAVSLGEVLATSDVPGGVVNILTGFTEELVPWLAGHMDVNALDATGVPEELRDGGRGALRREREARPPRPGRRPVRRRGPEPLRGHGARGVQDRLAPDGRLRSRPGPLPARRQRCDDAPRVDRADDRPRDAVEALAAGEWERARVAFEAAIHEDPSPGAEEGLARALWWSRDPDGAIVHMERAYAGFRDGGGPARRLAPRCGSRANTEAVHGNTAASNGWYARAEGLLRDAPIPPSTAGSPSLGPSAPPTRPRCGARRRKPTRSP